MSVSRVLCISFCLLTTSAAFGQNDFTDGVRVSDSDFASADLFVTDTSVLDGNVCMGNSCVLAEDFAQTILVKLSNTATSIEFNDSSGASFPARDWQITANDTTSLSAGGLEHFSIEDLTQATIPFTIQGGAPTGSLVVAETGNVGLGIDTPDAPLSIFRDDITQGFFLLESDEPGTNQDRPMMQLRNNGGIRFQFDNEELETAWRFQAATGNQDTFEVTKVGTGTIEFRVDASGNATLAGMLFENSDRNAKTNIETINPDEVLAKLAELPISEWEYKDTPGQRHVGPMAQDFRDAFGLGANDTSLATIDTSGVALASVKALHQQNLALRERNDVLEERLDGLAQQVAALTAVVKAMPAQAAQVAME